MSSRKKRKPLLTRLFGGKKGKKGGAGKSKGATADKQSQEAPRTRLQRSIAEMKQMKQLGEKDPERLARLLAAMFREVQQKEEQDKQRFDEMVWNIVRKSEEPEDQEGEDDTPPSPQ